MRDPEDHAENETYVRSVPTCGSVLMDLPEKYQYEKSSEILAGMKQIVEQLYSVMGEFFDVTKAEWAISDYGLEYPADSVVGELREDDEIQSAELLRSTVTDKSLDANSAITELQDLVEPLGGAWYPIEVTFDGRTRLYIDDEWQSVGADTPELLKAETASPHRDQRFEDSELITRGPLGINVHVTTSSTESWKLAYYIHVRLHTDIWNEDTTIGNVNRKQLEAFLARLVSEFDVTRVSCGDRARNSWVEDFVDPDHMG